MTMLVMCDGVDMVVLRCGIVDAEHGKGTVKVEVLRCPENPDHENPEFLRKIFKASGLLVI